MTKKMVQKTKLFNFKKGYIYFHNGIDRWWISILPELRFHIIGYRDGKHGLFPKKWEGVQINFTWLWFDIFYSSMSDNDLDEIEPFEW